MEINKNELLEEIELILSLLIGEEERYRQYIEELGVTDANAYLQWSLIKRTKARIMSRKQQIIEKN